MYDELCAGAPELKSLNATSVKRKSGVLCSYKSKMIISG